MNYLSKVENLTILFRKLSKSFVLITPSCFAVPKSITLNSTQYFIMKIPNKQEFQRIAFNHLSDIGCKDFMNLYKNVLQSHIPF